MVLGKVIFPLPLKGEDFLCLSILFRVAFHDFFDVTLYVLLLPGTGCQGYENRLFNHPTLTDRRLLPLQDNFHGLHTMSIDEIHCFFNLFHLESMGNQSLHLGKVSAIKIDNLRKDATAVP